MSDERHCCRVPGCRVVVPVKYLMCNGHWRFVSPPLQLMYWRLRHEGRPHPGFDEACEAIVSQVVDIMAGKTDDQGI